MNAIRIGVALVVVSFLSACAVLGAILDGLTPPTPQHQCEMQGGVWHQVTLYDNINDASSGSHTTGECFSK